MKKLYSLMFVIALMLTLGFISNIEAISLPASTGKITVIKEVYTHNPVTNTFTYTLTANSGNPATISGLPKTFTIAFNNVSPEIESGYWLV